LAACAWTAQKPSLSKPNQVLPRQPSPTLPSTATRSDLYARHFAITLSGAVAVWRRLSILGAHVHGENDPRAAFRQEIQEALRGELNLLPEAECEQPLALKFEQDLRKKTEESAVRAIESKGFLQTSPLTLGYRAPATDL